MSDQISAVADSLSLHIFMSVKKREVLGLWVGEHWVEVTGRNFLERRWGWAGWHPVPAAQTGLLLRCLQTQPSDTHGRWVIRSPGPMPPSHPSATSPVSVPRTSSFRSVSLGYWELSRFPAQPEYSCRMSLALGTFPSPLIAVLRELPASDWLQSSAYKAPCLPLGSQRKGVETKQPHRGDQSRREKDFPDLRHIKFWWGKNRKRWQCILKALVVQGGRGHTYVCLCGF